MLVFQELVTPDIGSPTWQFWWNAWNVILHVACMAALFAVFYMLIIHKNGVHKLKGSLRKKDQIKRRLCLAATFACTLICYAFLPWLHYFRRFYDNTSPFNGFPDTLYNILNPLLSVETIRNQPYSNLPSLNIGFRIAVVIIFITVPIYIFKFGICIIKAFLNYLNTLFNQLDPNKAGQSQDGVIGKAIKVVISCVGTVATSTFLANLEEIKDILSSAMDWVEIIVEKVFEKFEFPSNPSTSEEILRGLLLLLLATCIVVFLFMLLAALFAFIYHIVDCFPDILRTIKNNLTKIGVFVLKITAMVLSFAVLILAFLERKAIVDWVVDLVRNSPGAFLGLMQEIVLIALAACVFILLLFFVGTLAKFCYNQLNTWVQTDLAALVQSANRRKAVIVLLGIAAFLLISTILTVFTTHISSWLISVGQLQTDGIFLGIRAILIIAPAIVIVILLLLFLGSLLVSTISAFCMSIQAKTLGNGIRKFTNRFGGIFVRLFRILHNLIDTIMRIFQGYRTESEKNSAVYVAATFASLASLINTFFGLYNFNQSDETVIPLITSLAIAFAVQLAMLIFGMKAGQALAENTISETRAVGSSTIRALVKKLFSCGVYLLLYFTVKSALNALFAEQEIGFTSITLPNFLFWASRLLFGYAIVMDVLDIIFMLRHRKRQKAAAGTSAPVIVKGPAKRIPARYFMTAYLLLMIVSTGFAFNNLFGCYADTTELYKQVFDQVRYETDAIVSEDLTTVVTRYHDNEAALKELVSARIADAREKYEENVAAQTVQSDAEKDARADGDTTGYGANDALVFHQAEMTDFDVFCEALTSILSTDYDTFGNDVTIDVYTYDHYRYSKVRVEYTTVAIKITHKKWKMEIGRYIDCGNPTSTGGNSSETRYPDPDDDKQKVTMKHRVLTGQNKYGVIRELLNVFETMEQTINNFEIVVYKDTDNNYNFAKRELLDHGETNSLLAELETLDGVRRSIADLCGMKGTLVPVVDLHRVIYAHLQQYEGIPNEKLGEINTEPSGENPATEVPTEASTEVSTESVEGATAEVPTEEGAEALTESVEVATMDVLTTDIDYDGLTMKERRKLEFRYLERYVGDSLQIYNLLHTAIALIEGESVSIQIPSVETSMEPTTGGSPVETPTGETQATEAPTVEMQSTVTHTKPADQDSSEALQIRKYLSYARGIAASDFILSYDTLFGGAFGLNNTGKIVNTTTLDADEAESDHEDGRVTVEGRINALDSSQAVAAFILLICLLVDFMAFFAGLLLFQDAFLLDMKHPKAMQLGYMNLDSALTNFFMPTDEDDDKRKLQIALLHYLLYRMGTGIDYHLINRMKVDGQLLVGMVTHAQAVLRNYGLNQDSPDLHIWLKSFVNKNDIDFTGIL